MISLLLAEAISEALSGDASLELEKLKEIIEDRCNGQITFLKNFMEVNKPKLEAKNKEEEALIGGEEAEEKAEVAKEEVYK